MNLSAPFIRRPVGTMLVTLGMALSGVLAFFFLPVAPLPQIDFPTISVNASLPGASPETMGSSVAGPLEKRFQTIAGLTELTSRSGVGTSQITLQFDLARDVNGAARDVQAAINAARADLPSTLVRSPTYRKINPADAPIMILALTSKTRSPSQIYDAVSAVVLQRLLQVPGIGDAQLAGAALPAVRVDLDPMKLAQRGIALEDVRTALTSTNANRPKGVIEDSRTAWQVYGQTPGLSAGDYKDLVIAWRNGAAVRLRDVARVYDGAEDIRTAGRFNGERAVNVILVRQPGANIISTIDAVRRELPALRAAIPADIELGIASDLSTTIRASLHDVELALVISVLLVIGVVSIFLRSWRATVVPAIAVVTSLLGTLTLMYLLGFSLNNLSLMALTIATGFVVDDAIVVLENIQRHIEGGTAPRAAAFRGAREVGFTVLSITLSLVAVFIPLLFMEGLPGRLFREFAVTMTVAVLISLLISLTTTPMLAALVLRREPPGGDPDRWFNRLFARIQQSYAHGLDWAIAHRGATMLILGFTIALQVLLLAQLPKGLFPEQDTGSIIGAVRADQAMSFDALERRLGQIGTIIKNDPGVENVVAFTGGQRIGGGFLFVTLKPQRGRASAREIVNRLRMPLARLAGTTTFLNPVQDLRTGGRQSNSSYQYTLTSQDPAHLASAVTALAAELRRQPLLTDIDNDMSPGGASAYLDVARPTASRLGITMSAIDQTLLDSFGQRQVANIYSGLNQYHVIMGLAPQHTGSPQALAQVYVPAAATLSGGGTVAGSPGVGAGGARGAPAGSAISTRPAALVPLSAFARWYTGSAPAQTNHQSGEPAATLSFNLADGASIGDATRMIEQAKARLGMPADVRGGFAGTAQLFRRSIASLPMLVGLAILVIYIVLGILYESWIHPITVLSTLPSAGMGAVLALMLAGMAFDLIAAIGIILLIGIVKKNAILIIDFALESERSRGLSAEAAIREASLLRFRPILMTTLAAALGAVPLVIGFGTGAELRQPLGVAIFGGLLTSQFVTLFTTPVIFLALDRFRRRGNDSRLARAPSPNQDPQPV